MKTVLITGANRGIGLALFREAAQQGFSPIAIVRNEKAAESLMADFKDAKIYLLDLSQGEALEHGAKKIAALISQEFGHLDVLINNAGIAGSENQGLNPPNHKDFIEAATVNAYAPFVLISVFTSLLAKGTEPTVINIGARSGLMDRERRKKKGRSSYALTTAMKHMVGVYLSDYLAEHNIHILTVYPGGVPTRLNKFLDGIPTNHPEVVNEEIAAKDIFKIVKASRSYPSDRYIHRSGTSQRFG